MTNPDQADLLASIVHSHTDLEALLPAQESATHSVDELNHYIKTTEQKAHHDLNNLQHLVATFDSSASTAHDKIEAARQQLRASIERLEHRAEECLVQVQHDFHDATHQLNLCEQDVRHLHEQLQSEWSHSVGIQSDLERALGRNKDELTSNYNQVAHDYQSDLSSNLTEMMSRISQEMNGHRAVQDEVSSSIEQTLAHQQQSLAQAGESLGVHCSILLGNLQSASRQTLDNLHHSVETQLEVLRDGAQHLLGELTQAAEDIRRVISDIEGTAEAVKTGSQLTNVGIRDVIAILGEIIHLLENLEKDIEDVLHRV